jgi:hypothetical protein
MFGAAGLGAAPTAATERGGFEQLTEPRAPEQAVDSPNVGSVDPRTSRWVGSPWFALLAAALTAAGGVLVGMLALRNTSRVRSTRRCAAAPRAPPRLLPA